MRTITIRGTTMRVHEALHRALGHVGYHTGQNVTLAHTLRKGAWRYLTIPPGASEAYNRNPVYERPDGHITALGSGGMPT